MLEKDRNSQFLLFELTSMRPAGPPSAGSRACTCRTAPCSASRGPGPESGLDVNGGQKSSKNPQIRLFLLKVTCLSELFQLLVCVRVELLGDVLHPHEGAAVPRPRALHVAHRQTRVLDGTLSEGLDFLRCRECY